MSCARGGSADAAASREGLRPGIPLPGGAAVDPGVSGTGCADREVSGQGHPLVLRRDSGGTAQHGPSGARPGFGSAPKSPRGKVLRSPGRAGGLGWGTRCSPHCQAELFEGSPSPRRPDPAAEVQFEGFISLPRDSESPRSSLCSFQPRNSKSGEKHLQLHPLPTRCALGLPSGGRCFPGPMKAAGVMYSLSGWGRRQWHLAGMSGRDCR